MTESADSPIIWRCVHCGSLVHPSDERAPAAWCSRCGRVTPSRQDGGGREVDTAVSG